MMKKSSFFLLGGALVLAGGVALLARSLLAPPPKPPVVVQAPPAVVEPAPTGAILAVTRDLHPGDFIDGTHLGWTEVKGDPDRSLFFVRGHDEQEALYGATVRQDVGAGQPLRADLVVRQGEPGFLAAVLRPGMRAVSIPTSRVESNFGLASPGDRVDVILGLKREDSPVASDPKQPVQPLLAAQTILRDVRVLALNNQTLSERRDREKDASDKNTRSRFETVTLEVVPSDAEKLVVAKEIGTMQLALRSARESEAEVALSDRSVTTLRATTDLYSTQSKPKGGGSVGVQAFRGNKSETISLSRE